MNRNGFSLVEVTVTIGLISIMLGIVSFQFVQYSRKSAIESQTRTLYSDLMELRSKALFEKRSRGIKFSADSYSIYSSAITSVNPIQTTALKASIQWNNSTDIVFNSRGMLETADNSVICVSETNSASVDSVVVAMTNTKLGKLNGIECKRENIISK